MGHISFLNVRRPASTVEVISSVFHYIRVSEMKKETLNVLVPYKNRMKASFAMQLCQGLGSGDGSRFLEIEE